MTEAEWLAETHSTGMVAFLRLRKASPRKLRLFGCACCRRVWNLLPSNASRLAVEIAEPFADGQIRQKDLKKAYLACVEAAPGAGHDPAQMVAQVSIGKAAFWASYNARVRAAGTGPIEASQLDAHNAAMDEEGMAQAKLVHDIFGNPFQPVEIHADWLNWEGSTIPKMAEAILDARSLPSGLLDVARLGVLADALEDAGCTDDAILSHLRSPGPHVRGCWALDLFLAKE